MEILEPRIAPAGLIKISFNPDGVAIVGDAGDNSFSLTQVDYDTFRLTPAAGTQVQLGDAAPVSTAVTLDNMVRNVVIDLGGGSDTFTAGNLKLQGDLEVRMGTSPSPKTTNNVTFKDLSVGGSLKLTGAEDTVVKFAGADLEVSKNLVVQAGRPGALRVTLPTEEVNIGGSWTSQSAPSYTGTTKSISLNGAWRGAADVDLTGTSISALGDVNLTGDLDFHQGGRFFASGNATLKDTGALSFDFARVVVTGNLQMTVGDADVNVPSLSVAGNTKVSATGTEVKIAAEGGIAGNFVAALAGAKGSAGLSLDVNAGDGTLMIGGAFSATVTGKSAEAAIVALAGVQIEGKTTVLNKALSGVDFSTQNSTHAALNFTSTSKTGADRFTADGSTFNGAANINTGAGADEVVIKGAVNKFLQALKLKLGVGDDRVETGVDLKNNVFFGKGGLLDGGAGMDEYRFVSSGANNGTTPGTINFERVLDAIFNKR